jgi:hypothetical protein
MVLLLFVPVFLQLFVDGFKVFLFDSVIDVISESRKQSDGNDGNSVDCEVLFGELKSME